MSRLAVTVLALGLFALSPVFAAEINPPRGSKPTVDPAPKLPAPPVKPPPAAEVPLFEQERPLTAAALKADFRDDYDSLVDQFAEISETSGTPAERLQREAAALVAIAQKYAEDVQKAPIELSRDLVGRLADLHQAVLDKEGTKVCSDFANQGSVVLYTAGTTDAYAADLDALGGAYFKAVAGAQASPVAIDPVLEADWAALGVKMRADGVPDAIFRTLEKQDPTDAGFCDSMIAMMKGMLNFEGKAGERMRANLAKSAAVY